MAAGVIAASLLVAPGGEVAAAPAETHASAEARSPEGSGYWSLIKTKADQRGRKIRFRWWAEDCGQNDPYIAPATRVQMWEIGYSRVEKLRAKIMWQQWNPTFDRWNTTLQKTFTSGQLPASAANSSYSPPSHRFGEFVGEGRLVVKFTGIRDDLLDLNLTQVVARCTSRIIGGG